MQGTPEWGQKGTFFGDDVEPRRRNDVRDDDLLAAVDANWVGNQTEAVTAGPRSCCCSPESCHNGALLEGDKRRSALTFYNK